MEGLSYDFTPTKELEILDVDFATFEREILCGLAKTLKLPTSVIQVPDEAKASLPDLIDQAFAMVPVGVSLDVSKVHRMVESYGLKLTRIELFKMRTEGVLACRVVDNHLEYYLPGYK